MSSFSLPESMAERASTSRGESTSLICFSTFIGRGLLVTELSWFDDITDESCGLGKLVEDEDDARR